MLLKGSGNYTGVNKSANILKWYNMTDNAKDAMHTRNLLNKYLYPNSKGNGLVESTVKPRNIAKYEARYGKLKNYKLHSFLDEGTPINLSEFKGGSKTLSQADEGTKEVVGKLLDQPVGSQSAKDVKGMTDIMYDKSLSYADRTAKLKRYIKDKKTIAFENNVNMIGADDIGGHMQYIVYDEATDMIMLETRDIWKFTPDDYTIANIKNIPGLSKGEQFFRGKQAKLMDQVGEPFVLTDSRPLNLDVQRFVDPKSLGKNTKKSNVFKKDKYVKAVLDPLAPWLKNKRYGGDVKSFQTGGENIYGEKANILDDPYYVGYDTHLVGEGEWLTKIAEKYNIPVEEVIKLNPELKENPNLIHPGQEIKIPSSFTSTSTPVPVATPFTHQEDEDIRYDNNESFSSAFKQARAEKGPNKIFKYRGKEYITNIEGEPVNIDVVEKKNKNITSSVEKDIQKQQTLVNSVYSKKNKVDVNASKSIWKNWDDKKQENIDFNKLGNVEKITKYEQSKVSGGQTEYTVKKGDVLSLIARDHGVTVESILLDNDIENPRVIRAGQKLNISTIEGDEYLIVDKKNGRMHRYIGNKEIESFPVLTGKNKGDTQTVVPVLDLNKDGKITDADKRHGDWVYDYKHGNKTTGAGIYTINYQKEKGDRKYRDETGRGRSVPSFTLLNENGIEVSTAIHGLPSSSSRRAAIASSTSSDNRQSYGCINGRCSDLRNLYKNPNIKKGTKVYILPDSDDNKFTIQDGKLIFTPSKEEWEASIGEYKPGYKGQGINKSVKTISYNPVKVSIDKDGLTESGLLDDAGGFSGSYQEEKEFTKHTTPFVTALVNEKQSVLKALAASDVGISSDVYNDLIPLAFGIYGVESGMGDEHSGFGNMARGVAKVMDKNASSPDVYRKYHGYPEAGKIITSQAILNAGPLIATDWLFGTNTFGSTIEAGSKAGGAKGENNSVGWTQIRWKYLDKDEKSVLNKLGIKSQHDFMDPKKAAIGTIAILGARYNTRFKNRGYRDNQYIDILSGTWNNRANYNNRVKDFMKYITLYEGESKDMKPAFESKGDFYKKSTGTKVQMPGPAEAPMLYYKKGGEVDLDAPKDPTQPSKITSDTSLRMYHDYVNGNYNRTIDEPIAIKNYDKLNRIFYKYAKDANMSVTDYIMTQHKPNSMYVKYN